MNIKIVYFLIVHKYTYIMFEKSGGTFTRIKLTIMTSVEKRLQAGNMGMCVHTDFLRRHLTFFCSLKMGNGCHRGVYGSGISVSE